MAAARPTKWLAIVGGLTVAVIAVVLIWKLVGSDSVSSTRSYEALHSESKLVTASQDAKVTVTVEDDDFLPDFLSGQKAVVDANGRVEAYFDLSELEPGDVTVEDGVATIKLPPVRFSDPSISDIEWKVDDRGLFDRVSDLFSSDEDFRNRVIDQLNAELQAKGFGSGELPDEAEANATEVLEGLLEPLGVDKVVVEFSERTTPQG